MGKSNELLDDIDYFNDKVKCRRVEGLMGMVESEMEGMR
jgi:hypothetical protein